MVTTNKQSVEGISQLHMKMNISSVSSWHVCHSKDQTLSLKRLVTTPCLPVTNLLFIISVKVMVHSLYQYYLIARYGI